MRSKSISSSIIVPAYNEEKNIEQSLLAIKKATKGLISDYEIIIYNDCSTDNTGQLIEQLSSNSTRIKIVHNIENKGLGWILKNGYQLATKDYVIYVSGDNQVPFESLRKVIEVIIGDQYDAVITYHSNMRESRPLIRWIISELYNFIICKTFGLNVKYTTGPVGYRAKYIKKIDCHSTDRFVPTEILIKYIQWKLKE